MDIFLSAPEDMLIDLREGGRDREGESNTNVREMSMVCLSHTPGQRTEPAACQFTGRSSNQLSCTGQGSMDTFLGPSEYRLTNNGVAK